MSEYKELKRKNHVYNTQIARNIPLSVKLKVIFKNTLMLLGLAFGGMGLLVFIGFASQVNFQDYRFSDDSPRTKATVTSVEMTGASENRNIIYEYKFKFNINGKDYNSNCYTSGKQYNKGQIVDIIYFEDNPEIAKIENARRSVFDFWVLLFILPFILIGGIMAGLQFAKAFKAIYLLKYGQLTTGILIDKQVTNTQINRRSVYKFTFKFTANDGKQYEVIARTHITRPLEDEAEEMLVYDINNPNYAVMIDVLPKIVKQYLS